MFYALKTIQFIYKAQFLETGQFDTNNDGKLGIQERIDFLSSSEAKEVVKEKEIDSLSLSVKHLKENVEVSDGIDSVEVRVLQYVSHKILNLQEIPLPNGELDGMYGPGTRADIAAASGVEFRSRKVTQEHVNALIAKAEEIIASFDSGKESDNEVKVEKVEEKEEVLASPDTIFDTVEHFSGEKMISITSGDTLLGRLQKWGWNGEQRRAVNNAIKEKFSIDTDRVYVGDTFTFTHPEDGVLSVKIKYKGKELGESALEDAVAVGAVDLNALEEDEKTPVVNQVDLTQLDKNKVIKK